MNGYKRLHSWNERLVLKSEKQNKNYKILGAKITF